jgi:predicted nucleic acid-binding protein
VGKSKKVVIDTNVFISAFGWGGKPFRIIELLECALTAKAKFVITGDKRFLAMKKFRDINLVSPEKFLEILNR